MTDHGTPIEPAFGRLQTPIRMDLTRSEVPLTRDRLLWEVIKDRTAALSFRRYSAFIDNVLNGQAPPAIRAPKKRELEGLDEALNDDITNLQDEMNRLEGMRGKRTPSREAELAGLKMRIEEKRREQAQFRAAGNRQSDIERNQEILLQETMSQDQRDEAQRVLEQAAQEDAEWPTIVNQTRLSMFQSHDLEPDMPEKRLAEKSSPDAITFFSGDAYELLKKATELFVYQEAGRLDELGPHGHWQAPNSYLSDKFIESFRNTYLQQMQSDGGTLHVLPYLDIIRENLGALPVKAGLMLGVRPESYGILRSRLTSPILVELLWNYWQEQGLLVQTMNLVSLRFQNVRHGRGVDPLASLELDPLRPLSNILWGYIQDEISRLSVSRRAYEYAHGLGLQLVGKAIPEMHPADVRSQFLPAFHDLIRLAWIFFREDDDKMVVADAFPLLNALRELHFVIAEGAHNQFGDLPLRARIEMLMQQWILARPEMREFLRGRTMVPYPERWMDRVDAMKALQGWNDASVINYNDLATFGEQIILGVRYGSWSTTTDHNEAANWARTWRPAIQRYTHALRIVSGIDLSIADPIEVRTETERLAQGVPSARLPHPGGAFVRVPPPESGQVLAPRPGADKVLRPVPVASPAQIRGSAPSGPRSR